MSASLAAVSAVASQSAAHAAPSPNGEFERWKTCAGDDYVWMAQLTGQQQYITDAEDYLDWWTTGFGGTEVSYSPGGEAFLNQWGSLRYSANAAFTALEFSNYLTVTGPASSRRFPPGPLRGRAMIMLGSTWEWWRSCGGREWSRS